MKSSRKFSELPNSPSLERPIRPVQKLLDLRIGIQSKRLQLRDGEEPERHIRRFALASGALKELVLVKMLVEKMAKVKEQEARTSRSPTDRTETEMSEQKNVDQDVSGTAAELVEDLYGHEAFAQNLVNYAEQFQGGKVMSLRGPWGRGKTDVLHRAYDIAAARKQDSQSPVAAVLWVNPWQYGRANLLEPLLQALVRAIPAEQRKRDADKIKKIMKTMISAAAGVALKVAKLDDVASMAETLLKNLFDAAEQQTSYQADPVAPVGVAFKQLVDDYLASTDKAKSQVLIFVDDLDRCLPERQVALLEAFHFLVDAGANATFVMAIDGEILSAAVQAHYKNAFFDSNRYLDKIFDFNLELPGVSEDGMRAFATKVAGELKKTAREWNGEVPADFRDAFLSVVGLHSKFRNPRNLARFLEKMIVFIRGRRSFPEKETVFVLFWMMLLQTWPEAKLIINEVVSRGPQNTPSEGSPDQVAIRALMDFAKSAESEPYKMLSPQGHSKLEKGNAIRDLTLTYLELSADLGDLGL